jgi:thiamine-monophosphate kinase
VSALKNPTVGELGERALISRIRELFPSLTLLGDDSAVLSPLSCPVVTTDSFQEGTHFYRWWCDPDILGRRLLEAALSDLAAMGAEPGWVFAAMGLPPDLEVRWLENFYRGLTCRPDCVLAGGEIIQSAALTLTLTAVGEGGDPEKLLLRSSLGHDDWLWLTGPIGRAVDAPALLDRAGGMSGTGLEPVNPGLDPASIEQIRAFLQPRAEFEASRLLRNRGVRAAIDVSDGLISEATHLARESGVDTHIELDLVPMFGSVADRPLDAASAGEDFVLLFGAESGQDFAAEGFSKVGYSSRGIGEVHVHSGGQVLETHGSGYDHFQDIEPDLIGG